MESNEAFTATIPTSNSDCYGIGDKIVFCSYETRWWKKIINFIFRKSNEIKSNVFTVKEKSEGEIDIYPAIMENE